MLQQYQRIFNKIIWEKQLCVLSMLCACVGSWARCQKFEKHHLSWPCLSWKSFWDNSDPSGRNFMKFYIREFFENLSCEVKVLWNMTRIMSTSLDDRFKFLLGRTECYLEWENSRICCRESQTTLLRLINFSSKCTVFVIMRKVMLSETGNSVLCILDN